MACKKLMEGLDEESKKAADAVRFQLHSVLPPLDRTIHYYAELGQRTVFPTCEVPEHFVSEVTVLRYFSHYMEENLMDVS